MTDPQTVSLREYIERLISEKDRRDEQRFVAQEQAISTASVVMNEYKASSNEWREALKDQSSRMATRTELEKGGCGSAGTTPVSGE